MYRIVLVNKDCKVGTTIEFNRKKDALAWKSEWESLGKKCEIVKE